MLFLSLQNNELHCRSILSSNNRAEAVIMRRECILRNVSVLALALCEIGCGTIGNTYRNNLGYRRVDPLSSQPQSTQRVDLTCLVDPLGLGSSRIAKDTGSTTPVSTDCLTTGSQQSGSGAGSLTPEQRLEMAYLGFYDPQYPVLLCRNLNGSALPTRAFTPEEAKDVCYGMKADLGSQSTRPARYLTAVVTETMNTRKITQTNQYNDRSSDLSVVLANTTDIARDIKKIDISSQSYLVRFQIQRRNQIQDRILNVSNQTCKEFQNALLSIRSDTSFLTTVLSLGATSAGAIFSGWSQGLSAAGAGLIGTGAAYDSSYYQQRA